MKSIEKRNRIICFCGTVTVTMLIAFFLISGLVKGSRVNAEENPEEASLAEGNGEYSANESIEPTTWQNDYDYDIEGSTIVIKQFNVKDGSYKIVIDDIAVIDGNTYHTRIYPQTTSLFPNNNVSSFKVDEGVIIESAAGMFEGCTNLENVDLSGAVGGDYLTSTNKMFYNCSNLVSVDFGEDLDFGSATDMSDMFGKCSSLEELDLSSINFESLRPQEENETFELYMVDGCTSLKKIILPKEFGKVDSLVLPFEMYIKNDDGTIGEKYSSVTQMQAGKTLIVKSTPSIKSSDNTVTYNENAIDVTSLFEIGEGAGEAVYSLEKTDKATLENGKLTVTSAGTYTITVETKETDTMKSGKATAKLTVNKADGKCTISISDVDHGSKPSPAASSTTNPGKPEYLYKKSTDADTEYSTDVPTELGEYKVKAVFSASDLYNECSAEATFAIKPAINEPDNPIDPNKSKEDTTKNGLYYEDDGCWYLYNNGVINEDYTGLYYDPRYDWWYVENGKINKSFSGLYNDSNCGWWLVENGKVDKTYSDLYYDPKYGWWKIEEGTVDFGYNDLYESETCGWWLIIQGQVSFGYDDLYCSPKYGWWKVKDGEVDFRYSDLYDSKTYGWWLVLEGRVALEYSDLYGSETCGWWLVSGGKVDFDFSDLYGSPNYGWWLVLNGRVAFEYCDLYGSPTLGWWKVDHGYVDFEYTGLYGSSAYGWWLIGQGQVALNYNGRWEEQAYGEWDVAGGAVVF